MPKLLLALLVLAAVMPVSAQHQGHEHHAMPADAPMHEGHGLIITNIISIISITSITKASSPKVIKGMVITAAITTPLGQLAPPMTCVGSMP